MTKILLGFACAASIGSLAACGSGAGGRDANSATPGRTMTVAGCIAQGGDGAYSSCAESGRRFGRGGHQRITAAALPSYRRSERRGGAMGESGGDGDRKLEKAGQETTGATAADPNGGTASNLPSLRVAQLNGGGECTPAQ